MEKLDAIHGVNFSEADLMKYRSIPLHPEGESKPFAALTWMAQQLEHTGSSEGNFSQPGQNRSDNRQARLDWRTTAGMAYRELADSWCLPEPKVAKHIYTIVLD